MIASRWEWGTKEQEAGNAKGHKETFQDDRYIHYCDCSGGFMSSYSCENLSCVYFKYVQFIVCQLDFNKAVKNIFTYTDTFFFYIFIGV